MSYMINKRGYLMKTILSSILALLFLSCNSNSNDASFPLSENVNLNYVKLQKQLQTSYSLLKALNSGVITQEEYDKLKANLFKL